MKKNWLFFPIAVGILLFLSVSLAENTSQPSKTITFTFDDGPRPAVLEELLPLLEKYNIRANFFVVGASAKKNKELIKDMHDKGHRIENHSWDHENFKKLLQEKGPEAVKLNLVKTSEVIFEITGRYPKFFRPPYWKINKELEEIITASGYEILKLKNSDINTLDYADASRNRPPEVLIERVKTIIADREHQGVFSHVLIFHELPITVKALETLIPYFKEKGYQFTPLEIP